MNTKYKINQEVWYMDGVPANGKVTKITIFSETRTSYLINNRYNHDEGKISDSKEGLKKLLFN